MGVFCPECGVENDENAATCSGCGLGLGSLEDSRPTRPTRWLAVAILAVTSTVTVVLSYLIGLSLVVQPHLLPPLEEGAAPEWVLIIDRSVFLAAFPMIGFVVGALLVSLIFRGRYMREVALGARSTSA